jgi:hypothetical protein
LNCETGTDTVRVVATHACVAVFENGDFAAARVFEEDEAGRRAEVVRDSETGGSTLAGTPTAQ